jgi:hypothetical protein
MQINILSEILVLGMLDTSGYLTIQKESYFPALCSEFVAQPAFQEQI